MAASAHIIASEQAGGPGAWPPAAAARSSERCSCWRACNPCWQCWLASRHLGTQPACLLIMQLHGFLQDADMSMRRYFSFQSPSNAVGSLLRSCAMTEFSSGKMELRQSFSLDSVLRHNSSRPSSVSHHDDRHWTVNEATELQEPSWHDKQRVVITATELQHAMAQAYPDVSGFVAFCSLCADPKLTAAQYDIRFGLSCLSRKSCAV